MRLSLETKLTHGVEGGPGIAESKNNAFELLFIGILMMHLWLHLMLIGIFVVYEVQHSEFFKYQYTYCMGALLSHSQSQCDH